MLLKDILDAISGHATDTIDIHDLDQQDVRLLLSALKDTSNLKYVRLVKCTLMLGEARLLATVLSHNAQLKVVILSKMGLSCEELHFILEALKSTAQLQVLSLEDNRICGDEAALIAQWLKYTASLKKLNLKNNYLTDTGCTLLAEALAVTSSLTELDLSQNSIEKQGVEALVKALGCNQNLRVLHLGFNRMGSQAANVLLNAIVDSALTYLDLGANNLNDDNAQTLAKLLKANTSLMHLDCRLNSIKSAGFYALAEGLKGNVRLKYLNLSVNYRAESGALCALFNALTTHQALTTLKLACINIEKAISGLTTLLTKNSQLTTLDISKNHRLKTEAIQCIAEALKSNQTLRKISLKSIDLSIEALSALLDMLSVNHNLTQIKGLKKTATNEALIQQINAALDNNRKQVSKAQDNYIELCIRLARAQLCPERHPNAKIISLPPEILLHILTFLSYSALHKSSWSRANPGQAYYCALFIFNNIHALNQRLCHAYGNYPLIKEKKRKLHQKVSLQAFSFFKQGPFLPDSEQPLINNSSVNRAVPN